MIDANIQRRAAHLVSREVYVCLSPLVSTLAAGAGTVDRRPRVYGGGGLADSAAQVLHSLTWQAQELAAPILDYESAAKEAGWKPAEDGWRKPRDYGHLQHPGPVEKLCRAEDIEPHDIEVYEHWAVTSWLADKLEAQGERIDRDFAGMIVWARTTTGQAISSDSVIETIVAETGYANGGLS